MERRQRRIFPDAYKREAVDRITSSGLSPGRVAVELGLHETVLRRWMMRFGTQATGLARRPHTQAPAPSPFDLSPENARLRRDNDRLRIERDVTP
jgi:transposase